MHCPVCHADNDLQTTCRRCKADLTLLIELENQRAHALAAAVQALAQGQADSALSHAARAHHFRLGPDSRRLLALAHLLRRDFAHAWAAYEEMKRKFV